MQQIDMSTTLKVAYDAADFIATKGETGQAAIQIATDIVENSLHHAIDEGRLTANLGDAEVDVYDFESFSRFDAESNTVHLCVELEVSYDYVTGTTDDVQATIQSMFDDISGNGGLSGSSLLTVDDWTLAEWSFSGQPSSSLKNKPHSNEMVSLDIDGPNTQSAQSPGL